MTCITLSTECKAWIGKVSSFIQGNHICINLIISSQVVGGNFSPVSLCSVPSTTSSCCILSNLSNLLVTKTRNSESKLEL